MTELFPGPVLDALREAAGRPAVEIGGRTVTGHEMLAMVRRLRGALHGVGLGPGTGVGLVLSLSPQAYAVHLAAHSLGCRVAAARPGWSRRQLAAALWGPGRPADVVVADQPVPGPAHHLDELLTHPDPGGAVEVTARPDDLARLAYTSGSTGRPKACAHTYRSLSAGFQPAVPELLCGFRRTLIHQSLASPVMFTYAGRTLVAGGTVVLPGRLTLGAAIDGGRITATVMPPARLHGLLRDGAALGGLRALVLGGSPAGPNLLREAHRRLGPVVWQGYGQAEAGIIAMLTPADIAAGLVSGVGRPVPAVEVDVRDNEIWVRGPHVMTGYWGEPELTGEVLRDGWLNTRDLGHLDPDGMLHLTGRVRDVIMVNAEVCYSGAIEAVLATHPGVAQAYVVGAADPDTGEAIHAFVVPAGGQPPDGTDLKKLVRERLSANSVPATVTVVREVPLTANGKPDKRALLS